MSSFCARARDTRNVPGGEGAGLREVPALFFLVTADPVAPRAKQPRIATVCTNLRRNIEIGTPSSAACRPRTSSLTLCHQVIDRRRLGAQRRRKMLSLYRNRMLAATSLFVFPPKQPLNVRLIAFLRPTH